MADWRQIQARIRKARTGPDALAKMTALYERTRDAMVSFELAKLHENAGENNTAIEWYQVSADRFRRADWRKRAEDAIVRLGSTPAPRDEAESRIATAAQPGPPATEGAVTEEALPFALDESPAEFPAKEEDKGETEEIVAEPVAAVADSGSAEAQRKRTRRGRRGGRRRKKHVAAAEPVAAPAREVPKQMKLPDRVFDAPPAAPSRARKAPVQPTQAKRPAAEPADWGPIRLPDSMEEVLQEPRESVQRAPQRSRAGDPGLASRQAKLESSLRRLIAASPCPLEEADSAPAGPGVFLLSDAELTTYYYVERCQTLRVALRIVQQGQRGRDREESVRARLAEHLDINESQVSRYMKEHCVVRWIQLDEGAGHLAHYAIAVLQPALNE